MKRMQEQIKNSPAFRVRKIMVLFTRARNWSM